jgi:hypothetical protein
MILNQPSIAIFHPRMGLGGSEAVVMWTLEALRRDYCVALIAGGCFDLDALNSFYGTLIDLGACKIIQISLPWPLARANWGAALRGALVSRLRRRYFDRYDILIGAYNFGDFGRPGIHLLSDFPGTKNCVNSLIPRHLARAQSFIRAA